MRYNARPIRFEVVTGAENSCDGARASIELLRRKELLKSALGEDQFAKFIELGGT